MYITVKYHPAASVSSHTRTHRPELRCVGTGVTRARCSVAADAALFSPIICTRTGAGKPQPECVHTAVSHAHRRPTEHIGRRIHSAAAAVGAGVIDQPADAQQPATACTAGRPSTVRSLSHRAADDRVYIGRRIHSAAAASIGRVTHSVHSRASPNPCGL